MLLLCPLFRCPEDDKLISKFQGTWAQRDSMYETVIYAHMKTFRFTGTPALYIECDIRMCHGSCPVKIFLIETEIYICLKLKYFQTQPCSWREHAAQVKRKRRSVGNMTSVEEEEPEHAQDQDQDPAPSLGEAAPSSNGSFSESLRLFQSIQVLANEEDRAALQNSTAESRTHKTLI